jgi:sigma-B regulation protein RsbU (phosphoserine phosphatase)
VAALTEAVRHLAEAACTAGSEDLAGIAMRAATDVGARELVPYLVAYDQTTLVPLRGRALPQRPDLEVDGTVAGRVFATGRLSHSVDEQAGGHRLWLPMTCGATRMGVLELVGELDPTPQRLRDLGVLAAVYAEILANRRMVGDTVERTRRRMPMQLAAEIIWSQLPPLAFATASVAVSAVLEPCYDVGGDAFDYALDDGVAHVAIFDTVGHGIAASALTSLAISAYRNARRCGLDLPDTYRSIDKWVHAQYPESFVTAVLGELDTASGEYRRICAGHPGELLLRDGQVVRQMDAPTALPMGLAHLLGQRRPGVERIRLQPRDRLLFYTDGVAEARTADGEFFGVDRLAEFVTRALADRLPAPETMRRLVAAIMAHQRERLQDDATAALLEYRPEVTYGVHTGADPA